MSTSFKYFLTTCLDALGDPDASTWSRTERIWKWCVEAIQTFPILRPMLADHTILAAETFHFSLPADFREVISVEYPPGSDPPDYLVRKNRLDPDFYEDGGFYDIDHDFTAGSGWTIYFSGACTEGTHVYIQYLATHDTSALEDTDICLLTIPDEHISILIAYVVAKAYRERLGAFMQDPTAHSSIISQMVQMVMDADKNYQLMVERAQVKLSTSKITHHQVSDKFDRVY